MPALTSDNPYLPTKHPTLRLPVDWQTLATILAVIAVLLLEICIALTWLRCHDQRSKAKWRRRRENGIVIVNGPVLVWADDLPPQRLYSAFNLRWVVKEEGELVDEGFGRDEEGGGKMKDEVASGAEEQYGCQKEDM